MRRGGREPPTNRGSRPPRPQARQSTPVESSFFAQLRSALNIEDEQEQQHSSRPRGYRRQSETAQESFLDQLRSKIAPGEEHPPSRPTRSKSLRKRSDGESVSMLEQLRTKLGIAEDPQASSQQVEQRKEPEESRADSLLLQFRAKILGTPDPRTQKTKPEEDSFIDQFRARLMSTEHHEVEPEQHKPKVRIHSVRKGSHEKVVVVEVGRTSCSSSSDSFIDVETVPCPNSPKHSLANAGVKVIATSSGGILVPNQLFEDSPVRITCHHCASHVITELEYKKGKFTYILCGTIAAMGLILGCCLIPFFLKSCKDVLHKCPNCHAIVGRHNRIC